MGAQGWNINGQVPACRLQRISTFPPGGSWNIVVRLVVPVDRLAHCWVLKQQAPCGPPLGRTGWVVGCFCLFLRRPEPCRIRFPLRGACGVGMGVTGLLFENYIVDASILKY